MKRSCARLAPAVVLAGLFALAASRSSRADDFVVYSPYVTQGQTEFEIRGTQQRDSDPALSGTRNLELSVAHAFTSWWRPEIYLGEYERVPGERGQWVGNEFENVFQLAPQGEFWADPGFVLSYEQNRQPGGASAVEFGPLFEKQSGRVDQRLNLIWEKEVGAGASGKYVGRAAYAFAYNVKRAFAPGLEVYLRPGDNSYQMGPIVRGELASSRGTELEYRFGVVFGLNAAAPNQTFLARIEYEFY
jgi:hypothetical protein